MTLHDLHLSLSKIISELAALRHSDRFLDVAYNGSGETAEDVASRADTALLHLRCLRLAVERQTGLLQGREPND